MNTAYVGLGSNMGDREEYLNRAIHFLGTHPAISVENISSLYETDPVGFKDQGPFLNMAAQLSTTLKAEELLEACREIEQKLGRKRDIRWGPRTLDLDILLYNHENIETEQLIVPHPRMMERAFVLIPLQELNPKLTIPNQSEPVSVIIDQLQDKEGVRLWKLKSGGDGSGPTEN
ncbi:2-amino-4-hydroxy-6-hydroxymethyldihydropteridine diphosphokinase [Metabacillus kandeliae]|uniref:2-amino-4-hydroxy-6- hydroxymethyldihydropteridine diphosphokinase n=1 Tax=Metabacillus kandeliae TaxID=2900151 RepID=UPI0022B221CD|nr:2-amino-4-hydroxy-6-hydroxymethyldihydropteridine diphosphokinase [Metabacillus kandeliae]